MSTFGTHVDMGITKVESHLKRKNTARKKNPKGYDWTKMLEDTEELAQTLCLELQDYGASYRDNITVGVQPPTIYFSLKDGSEGLYFGDFIDAITMEDVFNIAHKHQLKKVAGFKKGSVTKIGFSLNNENYLIKDPVNV
jgi:hypothetical protein